MNKISLVVRLLTLSKSGNLVKKTNMVKVKKVKVKLNVTALIRQGELL